MRPALIIALVAAAWGCGGSDSGGGFGPTGNYSDGGNGDGGGSADGGPTTGGDAGTALDGGSPAGQLVLATGEGSTVGLAIDDLNVFWMSSPGPGAVLIRSVSKQGGAARTLASLAGNGVSLLALTTGLFAVHYDGGDANTVLRAT